MGRVLSEEEVKLIGRFGWTYGDIDNLISTICDRDETIAELSEYLQMVLNVAKDLDDGVKGLLRLHTKNGRTNDPIYAIIPAASATERYTRIIRGENVGCLEGNETDDDRERFMQRLRKLHDTIAKVKGGATVESDQA